MQKLRSKAVRRFTMVFLDAYVGTNVQNDIAKGREFMLRIIPDYFSLMACAAVWGFAFLC